MRKGTESGLDSPRGVFPALLLTVECVAGTTREHQIKVELLFAQSVISIASTLCQFLPGTAAGEFPEQESDCDPRNATVGEFQSLPHQHPCNVLTRNIFDQRSHQSVRLMVTWGSSHARSHLSTLFFHILLQFCPQGDFIPRQPPLPGICSEKAGSNDPRKCAKAPGNSTFQCSATSFPSTVPAAAPQEQLQEVSGVQGWLCSWQRDPPEQEEHGRRSERLQDKANKVALAEAGGIFSTHR